MQNELVCILVYILNLKDVCNACVLDIALTKLNPSAMLACIYTTSMVGLETMHSNLTTVKEPEKIQLV